MMWKLTVFIVVILVKDAYADDSCACYEVGNYTGRSAPISSSYNINDFSPCYKPCSYVAYGGDDSYRWTGLTFNWGTVKNSGGHIQIFDGPDDSGTPIIQITEGENVLSGSAKSNIKSSSPRITIKYTQTGTDANDYYGVIKALPKDQPSTAAPTNSQF